MGHVGHTPQIPVSAVKVVVKSSPKQGTAALEPHKLVSRDFSLGPFVIFTIPIK